MGEVKKGSVVYLGRKVEKSQKILFAYMLLHFRGGGGGGIGKVLNAIAAVGGKKSWTCKKKCLGQSLCLHLTGWPYPTRQTSIKNHYKIFKSDFFLIFYSCFLSLEPEAEVFFLFVQRPSGLPQKYGAICGFLPCLVRNGQFSLAYWHRYKATSPRSEMYVLKLILLNISLMGYLIFSTISQVKSVYEYNPQEYK